MKDVPVQLTALGVTLWVGALSDDEAKVRLKPLRKIKGVSWANPLGTVWFLAECKGSVVGAVAYVEGRGEARFKSDAVLPEFRGRGLYSFLFGVRLSHAEDSMLSRATCFSSKDSRPQFLKSGFKVVRESSNGIAFMEKRF